MKLLAPPEDGACATMDQADNVETKESTFEAAVTAASLALRQGHDVRLLAPGSETATGAANAG